MDSRENINRLKEEKFDFGITESFGMCAYILFKETGLENYARAFATDIFGDFFGVSNMPTYVPSK